MSRHSALVALLRSILDEGDDPEDAFRDAMREIEPPYVRGPGPPPTLASLGQRSFPPTTFAEIMSRPNELLARLNRRTKD